jgi:hypothetical protein
MSGSFASVHATSGAPSLGQKSYPVRKATAQVGQRHRTPGEFALIDGSLDMSRLPPARGTGAAGGGPEAVDRAS